MRGHGEGSVYQRKDGRWVASITLENHKRKYYYGDTRKEAYEKLRKAQRELDQGLFVTGPQQTVKQYLTHWLEDVHKPKIRSTSYAMYVGIVQNHLIPALGHLRLQKLTAQEVQRFYADKMKEGLSPGTIHNMHVVLHRALKHAKRMKLVGSNVCDDVDLPRYRQPEIKALTMEQAQNLLQKVREHRLEALLTLALATGMRRGEILALHWEDISFEERTLQVRRSLAYDDRGYFEGEPKTARSRRTIVLPHFVIDVLKKHQASQMDLKLEKGSKWVDRGLVFCGKDGDYLLPQTLHYQFTRFLEDAGLPSMRFHDLRHSAVTLLLAMGVDPKSIQELVGHQSITTTLGVYGHLLLSMQMGIADKLDNFFNQEQS